MNFRPSRDEHSSSLCSRGDRSFCRLRQFMKIACRLSVLAAALFPNQHFYPAFHHGFVQTKKQPKILCVAMLQWPCFLTPCNLDHFEDFFYIQVYLCSSKIIFLSHFSFFPSSLLFIFLRLEHQVWTWKWCLISNILQPLRTWLKVFFALMKGTFPHFCYLSDLYSPGCVLHLTLLQITLKIFNLIPDCKKLMVARYFSLLNYLFFLLSKSTSRGENSWRVLQR